MTHRVYSNYTHVFINPSLCYFLTRANSKSVVLRRALREFIPVQLQNYPPAMVVLPLLNNVSGLCFPFCSPMKSEALKQILKLCFGIITMWYIVTIFMKDSTGSWKDICIQTETDPLIVPFLMDVIVASNF